MGIVVAVIYWIALIAFYILWARVIVDLIMQLRRDWKPKGFLLVVMMTILRITDPPLAATRRIIRPLKIGGVALDLAMLALMLGLLVIMWCVQLFL